MDLLYSPITAIKASNNLLKFLAAIITLWIDILTDYLQSGDCALSMTDSSTAEGWMLKMNFRASDKDQIQTDVRVKAAQKFAMDFTKHAIKSYSQWFPGKENIVADALSHGNDRTNGKLTSILYSFASHEMPNLFRIVPLHNKIISWLILLLTKLPVKEQYREAHTVTKHGRGKGGMKL
jgi:hypothetical protein